MAHFDDLTPHEHQALMDALFPPDSNARKIIDSTPSNERTRLDQALAAHDARREADANRRLLLAIFQPEEHERLIAHDREEQEKFEAAMQAMTSQDWIDLNASIREIERKILRERGIDPE